MAEWKDETGLTRTEQETARKNLIASGLLSITRKHTEIPGGQYCHGRLWFRLNIEALANALEKAGSTLADTMRNLIKPVAKVAKVVKTGIKKAEKIAKKVSGKNNTKTTATHVTRKPETLEFSTDDFNGCGTFVRMFAGNFSNPNFLKKRSNKRLIFLFRRFGFNSHYVEKCFNEYAEGWVTGHKERCSQADAGMVTFRDGMREHFNHAIAELDDTLAYAKQVQPKTFAAENTNNNGN